MTFLRLSILYIFICKISFGQSISIQPQLLPLNCSSPGLERPAYIMLHYVSQAVVNPSDPYSLPAILAIFKKYSVSAHYLIDREGQIFQLVAENRKAHHAGKGMLPNQPHTRNAMNSQSIGIELMGIGTAAEMAQLGLRAYDQIDSLHRGFTEAQYQALDTLLDQLCERYQLPKNRQTIVGHDAYAPERRGDPGQLFRWDKLQLAE